MKQGPEHANGGPSVRTRLFAWLLGLLGIVGLALLASPISSAIAFDDKPAVGANPRPLLDDAFPIAPRHAMRDRVVAAGDCDARGWAEHSLAAPPPPKASPDLSSVPRGDRPLAANPLGSWVGDLPEPVLAVQQRPFYGIVRAQRVADASADAPNGRHPEPPLRPPRS